MTFMTRTSEAAPRISSRLVAEPVLRTLLSLEELGEVCSFPWFRNGWEFLHDRHRIDIDPSGAGTDRVDAVIHGSAKYDVSLWCQDGQLHSSCSCPFVDKDGYACKHVAALGLMLLGYPDAGLYDLVWDESAGDDLFNAGRFDEFAQWALSAMNLSTKDGLRFYNDTILAASSRLRQVATNQPKYTSLKDSTAAFVAHARLASEYVVHVQRRFGAWSKVPYALTLLLDNHAAAIEGRVSKDYGEDLLVFEHTHLAVVASSDSSVFHPLVGQVFAFHRSTRSAVREVLQLFADCVYRPTDVFRTSRFHEVSRAAVAARAAAAKELLLAL